MTLAAPVRGRCSARFARWQREKILVRDQGENTPREYEYMRARRNLFPRGTIDLWLPDTLPPSSLNDHRGALGWYYKRDEDWVQDIRPVGRGRRVRLYGKPYFPLLESFRVTEKALRGILKGIDQGAYLGTSAVAKHVVLSMRDKVLLVVVGRPGGGKSLQGAWIATSLLAQGLNDITIYDVSTVDFGHLRGRCRVITELVELADAVAEVEAEAARRLERMREAGKRLGQRVADSKTYERLTGEPMPLKTLVIDEMQDVMGKRLGGSKDEAETKKVIADRINAIVSKYRKVNVAVVLLGTTSQSNELNVSLSAAAYKSAGYLGHAETSRAFLDGSPLANNQALTRGRMVVSCADLSLTPFVIQVPVGLKEKAKSPGHP